MEVKMINLSCKMNLEVVSGYPCNVAFYAMRSAEEACKAHPCLAPIMADMLRASALNRLKRITTPAKPKAVQGMADYSREYEEDDLPYQEKRREILQRTAPLPELRKIMNGR